MSYHVLRRDTGNIKMTRGNRPFDQDYGCMLVHTVILRLVKADIRVKLEPAHAHDWKLAAKHEGLSRRELGYVWTHPNSQFAASKQAIQPNQCHPTDRPMFAPKCIARVFDISVDRGPTL